jgi:hypothetical protein
MAVAWRAFIALVKDIFVLFAKTFAVFAVKKEKPPLVSLPNYGGLCGKKKIHTQNLRGILAFLKKSESG